MSNDKPKMICFGMDDTIADLYEVKKWDIMLFEKNIYPYTVAKPMYDMSTLAEIIRKLQKMGIEIRIITWLGTYMTKNDKEFKNKIREAKIEWLEKWGFPYDVFHGVQCGATKANSVRRFLKDGETAWLIDGRRIVRHGWHLGKVFDPYECNILEVLTSLLDN